MAAKQQKIDELLESIDRRQIEAFIRTTLERARRRKGLTAEQAAELLGTFQPRVKDVAGRGRWYEWTDKPDSLTATAFMAAAILAGITDLGGPPLDTNVEEAGTNQEDRERLDRLEARHEQDIQALREEFREMLRAEMLELREELRGLGRIGRGISTELDEDKRPT